MITNHHIHARLLGTLLTLTAALASSSFTLRANTHVWGGAGANANFSTAANWSAGGAPVAREANVILIFPAGAVNKNPVQNIPELGIDQLVIQGDGYTFSATAGNEYFLRGNAAVDIENQTSSGTVFDATAPMTLNVGEVLIHGTNGTMFLYGELSGAGALRIDGPTVELNGTAANTYAGATTLANGTLKLSKSPGVTAVPGALIVGNTNAGSVFPLDDVILVNSHQIADGAPVTVHRSGRFRLEGNVETIGALDMTGGSVSTGFGALTLGGNVHAAPTGGDLADIAGQLSLGTAGRSFTVEAGSQFRVSASISGGAGVGFTKLGAGTMEIWGANTYSGPTAVNEGELLAYGASVTFGTAAAGTTVAQGAKLMVSWADIGAEPLQLNGDAPGTNGSVFTAHGSCSWAGPVTLNGNATNTVQVLTVDMEFSGAISGAGALRLLGEEINFSTDTKLTLSGAQANTYTGGTVVEHGWLHLNKTPGVNAIPGALLIGYAGATNMTDYPKVTLLASHQIADSAVVSTHWAGSLELGAFSDTIAGLDMSGGQATTTSGTLTLAGDVVSRSEAFLASLEGKLSLGNQTRVVQCFSGSYLLISAAVSGSGTAGITKTGPGYLYLRGANTYPGLTMVAAGELRVQSNQALGSTAAGTVVSEDASLELDAELAPGGLSFVNEALELNSDDNNDPVITLGSIGLVTWTGPITVNTPTHHVLFLNPGSELHLNGAISGPGTLQVDALSNAKVVLGGASANTYTGGTFVRFGQLHLAKPAGVDAVPGGLVIGDGVGAVSSAAVTLLAAEQIADAAPVTINADGGLDLNNYSEFIGSLAGNGRVFCQTNELVTGANGLSTVWAGGILGNGPITLSKIGLGTMQITGDNYYSGKTTVQGGWLDVRGSLPDSQVQVYNTGKLMGTGTVGGLQNFNGGTTSPGASVGTLHSGNLSMGVPGIYRVELDGTQADQLDVVGTVNVAGTLQVLPTNASPVGTTFVILNNDGADAVSGSFTGLPQNAEFIAGGQRFRISYTGGDGNDVVLTHLNTPPAFTSVTATAFASEGGTVHLDGTISDPDTADTFALVVNWGDGSAPQTFNFPAGSTLIHLEHVYADDKPGAQPSDSFTIEYTLTDTSGSPAFGQLSTVIGNVAPSFGAPGSLALKSGQPLNATVSFADPGADTWTATVDYGDGTGTQPLAVGPGRSLALNHAFPTNGTYTVTLNVSDDDTGTGSGTLTVHAGLELSIARRSATHALVSWPGVFTGFTLQSSPVLPATNWTTVPGAPALLNDTWQLTVPSTNGNAFFRLVK